MLQFWLQPISFLCCSEAEWVSEHVYMREGGREGRRDGETACASTRDLPHSRLPPLCFISPLLLSSPILLVVFIYLLVLPHSVYCCSIHPPSPFSSLTSSSHPLYTRSSPTFCSCAACRRWHLEFWGAGAGSPPASFSCSPRCSATGLPGPGFALSRLVLQQSVDNIGQNWVSATCLLHIGFFL